MFISISDSEWILKLGPIVRVNHAGGKEQAEEGAVRQVLDDGKVIMDKSKDLLPLLIKGISGEVSVKEENIVPEVVSYQLSDGKWFCIASSNTFGFKASCRK